MEENLVCLFDKLSKELLLTQKLASSVPNKNEFSGIVKAVRRCAFDVIHNTRLEDLNCNVQRVGGLDWGPEIYISDYAFELINVGYDAAGSRLLETLDLLENYEFCQRNSIYQFLLNLKGPFVKENVDFEHPFSLSGQDYFLLPNKPYNILPKDLFKCKEENKESLKEDLFLDNFIETRTRLISSPIFKPSLLDFVDLPDNSDCPTKKDNVNSGFFGKAEFIETIKKSVEGPKTKRIGSDLSPEPSVKEEEDVLDYASSLKCAPTKIFKRRRKEKPKASPSALSLAIILHDTALNHLMDSSCEMIVPKEVILESYVSQVKYLLCGIDGDIFKYDEGEKKFFMKVGVYIKGITPPCLFEISKMYMETGTFLRNLHSAVNDGVNCKFGVIYPAFWKSVKDYLQRHCYAVARIPLSCSILSLKMAVTDIHSAMTAVHQLCLKRKGGLPSGGLLLSYLFESSCAAQHDQFVQNVIFSFLFDCCNVYISKLVEKWVFQGLLDTHWATDLFVRINTELSNRRDRNCYLSITADQVQVPSFLQSLASKILSCGKAVWLLKLFDPQNQFIYYLEGMKNPKMRIATTQQDFSRLEQEFNEYEKAINDFCGSEISFATIREVECQEEKKREIEIKELQFRAETRLSEQRAQQMMTRRLQAEKREALLYEQLIAIEKKRMEKRQEKLLELQRITKEDERCTVENRIIAETKAILEDKYKSLTKAAEIAKSHADWQSKRLAMQDRRVEFLKQDIINENAVLDEEGNIMNTELDVENANVTTEAHLDNTSGALERKDIENIELETESSVQETSDLSSEGSDIEEIFGDEDSKTDAMIKEKQESEACKNKKKNLVTNYIDTESNCQLPSSPPKVITEAMKNKLKVLGVEYNLSRDAEEIKSPKESYTDANINKTKILGATYFDVEDNSPLSPSQPQIMTEAMRNKVKVLGVEYNLPSNAEEIKSPKEGCTDANRNKMKILGATYFDVKGNSQSLANQPEIMTEAMRNKMKVLGVEYNISDTKETRSRIISSTDVYRNKLKIMSSSNVNDENMSPVATSQQFSVLTDAQRNKLKVLGTEYNIPLEPLNNKTSDTMTDREKNKIRMHKTDIVEEIIAVPPQSQQKESEARNTTLREKSEDGNSSDTDSKSIGTIDSPIKEAKKTVLSFDVVNPDTAIPGQLFEIIPLSWDPEPITRTDEEIAMFTKHLHRSISFAVGIQERLANAAILKHFLLKENLMGHMISLRNYFLLHDGEFCRSLTNGLFHSLAQCTEPQQFFDRSSLSAILNEALIYTTHASETYADNISFQIVKMPAQLNHQAYDVLTPFQLSYKVIWPLNIIITDACLERYRQIFHVLVNLKRVHWTLNETFLLLKTQTKDGTFDGKRLMNSPEYIRLATYRHAMTLFMMTLEEHINANGPQEAWSEFMKQLVTVRDLDHLYERHVAFVKDVYKRTFLVKASQDLLSYTHEMIELGLKFHFVLKSSNWRLLDDVHYGHPKYNELRSIFIKFCSTTRVFNKVLRKKTLHSEMKIHIPLVEMIDLKMKV